MIRHYVAIAVRNLRKHSGYTLIHLAGLACGFAVTLLIFLFIQNERSFDRLHEKSDHIAQVIAYREYDAGQMTPISHMPLPLGPTMLEEYSAAKGFVRISGADQVHVIAGGNQDTEHITFADPGLFSIFSFPLIAGDPGKVLQAPTEAVLTERLAIKYFGTTDILGESIEMFLHGDRRSFTIVGVARDVPQNSTIQFSLVIPMTTNFRYDVGSTNWNWWRVRTFVEFDRPIADLDTTQLRESIAPRWDDRQGDQPVPFTLCAMRDVHLNPATGGSDPIYSYILAGIALIILVIAGINYVSLGIARGTIRRREVAVRKLFGAVRQQVMIQFLAESVTLALIAAVIGFALAELALPTFGAFVGRQMASAWTSNHSLIIFGLLIAVLTGLGAGLVPAFVLSRPQPADIFRRAASLARSGPVMRGMIVIQLGLSVFLFIATIVMQQQSHYLQNRPLGYSPHAVMVVERPADNSISDRDFLANLRNELGGEPRILSVSATSASFNRGYDATSWNGDNKKFTAYLYRVDPAYVATLGMTVVAGRDFQANPAADAANPIIVNESLMEQLGPRYAVGSQVPVLDTVFEGLGTPTIVGVVKDYHFLSLHEKIEPALLFTSELYPYFQLLVRIDDRDIPAATAAVERAYEKISNGLKCNWSFLDDDLAQQYINEHRWSKIVSSSALFAIGIAALGIFGLAGITAVRRSREVGIRKVLGASVPQVLAIINREFILMVLIANLIVWPIAWYAAHKWLQNFAYHIELSVWSFALAALVTTAVALTAVSAHTLRAALLSPARVLRQE